MAKRERLGYPPLAEAIRQFISAEDNRHHVHKLLGLEVEQELTPTLASLLEAIGKAGRDETP
ncbi:hypothetical protein [Mesorhizobium sp.]|uniref:hypothetical protein n=1 Tax=Mesorhizobium sp. TaxID=1871066 RepID=UPI000FE2B492|nr:hypothetical protein [Mesorhizobium sp.]RWO02703.1 MAG: hypothetical protein EOS06_00790 [Mesorhizobium sp.]TIN28757.1 MAG: hypothetical protein E5Y19_05640 [Mesorhizobium sp.]TIN37408.1 MAG: hypothetical protein E5Y13_20710 [Mesorhizobium sp.]TJU86011.1 MAG: hypothetical protein E5Y15_11700 [Mesorhizobium sp.]TJU88279.1 MAG: hypothetical protein E5Y10_17375 [Mesorhizobium sp.]